MLTKLKNLTHLTTDHPAALQSERHPIPMAADLIMSGVYVRFFLAFLPPLSYPRPLTNVLRAPPLSQPSDISGKLEKCKPSAPPCLI